MNLPKCPFDVASCRPATRWRVPLLVTLSFLLCCPVSGVLCLAAEPPDAAIAESVASTDSGATAAINDKKDGKGQKDIPDSKDKPGKSGKTAENEPGESWIRILRNKSGEPLALQTAIVRYRPAKDRGAGKSQGGLPADLTVDLVGAVHVGDKAYYDQLNRRFKKYEVLLFELVAPEGVVVRKGRGTSNLHPIGAMQNGLKGVLELEHQLEHIDYTRDNFVHADMSPSQLAKSMDKRGESFLQMYFRLMGAEMARQSRMQAKGKSAEFDLLAALFSSDRTRKLKIALAEQFENIETLMVGFNGPDGSTLITERNRVALKALSQQIKKGRRRLGVFYGAGHLPDMHERLKNDFQLQPVRVIWIEAWNLRPK